MTQRFNPPPGWPLPPAGFRPPPNWRPDPSWPAPPPGWQVWVEEEPPAERPHTPSAAVVRTHAGDRNSLLHLLIAISIGLVSVMGAVVLWRAETHAGNADAADQDAISASITAAHLHSTAEQAADTAQRRFARYQRLGQEAGLLDPGTNCTDKANTNPASVAQIDALVNCEIQIVFSGYADETSQQGSYDVTKYTNDVLAFRRYFQPNADPAPYEAKAAGERALEHKLLGLSIALVGVLALFTLARLGRTERRCLVLAVPGWALFTAAVVAVLAVEV